MIIIMRKNKRKLYSKGRHACSLIRELEYVGMSDAKRSMIELRLAALKEQWKHAVAAGVGVICY